MSDILDDPEAVENGDPEGMFETLSLLPHQIVEASEQALRLPMEPMNVDGVVVCGMGGSAIGGDLMKDWIGDRMGVPVEVSRGYHIPTWVGEDTLVFLTSYSGNTEETLSAFEEALEVGANAVAVTTGGQLRRRADEEGVPTFMIPTIAGMPPRLATAFLLFPMAMTCHRQNLVEINGEMEEAVGLLKRMVDATSPQVPLADNSAKIYAKALHGTVPMVYAPPGMGSLARRWCTQLNENSKVIARWDVFPEMNHNDIEGLGGDEHGKRFSAVILRDTHEHPRVKKRIEYTRGLMENRLSSVIEVWPRGENHLSRMLQHLYMGDCVSLYLAVLRGVDPFGIPAITGLKEHLAGR